MGSEYEVYSFHIETGSVQKYAGSNPFKALWRMWQLKRLGYKYIKLEWRP